MGDIVLPRPLYLAALIAANSDMKFKLGAVVTSGSNILALSCNRSGTISLFGKHAKHNPWSRHAEVRAIKDSGIERARGATIWIARGKWDSDRKEKRIPAFAKPCADCMQFMMIVGVKRVVYTIEEPPYFTKKIL